MIYKYSWNLTIPGGGGPPGPGRCCGGPGGGGPGGLGGPSTYTTSIELSFQLIPLSSL